MENKRPWWHYVLGCGCIAVLISMFAAVGGTYWAYKKVSSSIFFDSVKVNALAAEILPGAKPIPGHEGFMGWDALGVRMAMIGPPTTKGAVVNGDSLLIVILGVPDKKMDREEAKKQMQSGLSSSNSKEQPGDATPGNTTKHTEKVISNESTTISVGGKSFEGEKQLVEDEKKARSTRYMVGFKKGTGVAFVMVQGAEGFNEAPMASFFSGIDASGLEPLESKGGAAPPAVAPEQTPSPAATSSED